MEVGEIRYKASGWVILIILIIISVFAWEESSEDQYKEPFSNLIRNGSFEEGKKYWNGKIIKDENQFKVITLEDIDEFGSNLDVSYIDQAIQVQYQPKKIEGSLLKSTVSFRLYGNDGRVRSVVTYVLNGGGDHWASVNKVVRDISYITIVKNDYKIGEVSDLIFQNILRDQNVGARKIGAKPLIKEDIKNIYIIFKTWFNGEGSILVSHHGWDQYRKVDEKNLSQLINIEKNRELKSKPAIYQVRYLPSDGDQYIQLKSISYQKVVYSQSISTKKNQKYLLLADTKVKAGTSPPKIQITNSESKVILLESETDIHLAQMGWVSLGGVFTADGDTVEVKLIVENKTILEENDYRYDQIRLNESLQDYDNIRLLKIPSHLTDDIPKFVKDNFDEEITDSIIHPRPLNYKALYTEDFSKKLKTEYGNLNVPIYDLYFNEKDFFSVGIEERRKNKMIAHMNINGRNYKIKIKTRGTGEWNYQSPVKSMGIDFIDPKFADGKKSIYLVRGRSHNFLVEDYAYYVANKLDLMTLSGGVVFVRINDKPYDLMSELAGWDSEILEGNKRPIGDLYDDEIKAEKIYYSDLGLTMYDFQNINKKLSPSKWRKYIKNINTNKADMTNILLLVQSMNFGLLDEYKNLINIKEVIQWNVHSILLSSNHQDHTHNNRPYFNNTYGGFEFIPWDIRAPKVLNMDNMNVNNPFSSLLLKDVNIFNERNRVIWNYVKEPENRRADMRYFENQIQKTENALNSIEHYGFFGETIATNALMKRDLIGFLNSIPDYYTKIQKLLEKNTSLTATVINGKDAVKIKISPKQGMFSSGVLKTIIFSRKNLISLYRDNGNGLFEPDEDQCLLNCSEGDKDRIVDLNDEIPSKVQYEIYKSEPPFAISSANFDNLMRSSLLSKENKEILTNGYEYDKREDAYLVKTFNNNILKEVLRKAKYISSYKGLTYFATGNFDGLKLADNIIIDAENITTGKNLYVEYITQSIINDDQEEPTFHLPTFKSIAKELQRKYPNNVDIKPYKYLHLISATEEQFQKTYSYLIKDGDERGVYRLPTGVHEIKKTIIVPRGITLTIEPGATLKFSSGKSLIAYGKIKAIGTKESPIIFTSLPFRSWGVVGLVREDSGGEFEHCVFENGGDAYINGVYFSGMLSAYHANASVISCKFQYAGKGGGDDALNFKNGLFTVENSYFYRNEGDAIDFDFVEKGSEIKGNYFEENENDSMDISGSNITITNNRVNKSGDKCISIGEESTGIIQDNILEQCNFGIAAKDSSEILIVNNNFIGNNVGVSAYNKKANFGGANVKVYNSLFQQNRQDFGIEVIGKEDDRYSDGAYKSSGVVYNSTYQLSEKATKEVIREPKRKSITKKQVTKKQIFKAYVKGDLSEIGYKLATLVNSIDEGAPKENPYKNLPIGIIKQAGIVE
jgi:parallel beta-helix repeat protein